MTRGSKGSGAIVTSFLKLVGSLLASTASAPSRGTNSLRSVTRIRSIIHLAFICLVAPVYACANVNGPAGSGLSQTGDFTIDITSGLMPTFSWPGGNAIGVMVTDLNSITPKWGVIADDYSGFPSPATYNKPIPHTSTLSPTLVPLTKGVRYTVIVQRADNRIATREFLP